MSTKTPGETGYEAFRSRIASSAAPFDERDEVIRADWEAFAQAVLTAHAPKITPKTIAWYVHRHAGAEGLTEAQAILIADELNKILSTPKAPAQEPEWEEFTGKEAIARGYKKQTPLQCVYDGGWKDLKALECTSDWVSVTKYRRPRQPQQAGKESQGTANEFIACLSTVASHFGFILHECDWEGDKRIGKSCRDAEAFINKSLQKISKITAADPILTGGWPLKAWEDLKAFLISYSMYSEAAMIRWVMSEGDSQAPKGGDGGPPDRRNENWGQTCTNHNDKERADTKMICPVCCKRELDTARSTIKSLETRLQQISKLSDEYREASIEQAKLLGEARAEFAKVKGELEAIPMSREEAERVKLRFDTLKSQLETSQKEREGREQYFKQVEARNAELHERLNRQNQSAVWHVINPSDPATLPKEEDGNPKYHCVLFCNFEFMAIKYYDAIHFDEQGDLEDDAWLAFEPTHWMRLPILPPLPTPAPEVDAFEKWIGEALPFCERGSQQWNHSKVAYAAGQAQGGIAK